MQDILIPSETFPDQFNESMESMFDYWLEKCPDGASGSLPKFADFDLMDLYKIADHLLVCDVIRQGDDSIVYRWRFWGSELSYYFGVELSGKFINDINTPETAQQINASYNWVVENQKPHYWLRRGGLASDNQEHLAYERLICPVLGQFDKIDYLFGIITFERGETQSRVKTKNSDANRVTIANVE